MNSKKIQYPKLSLLKSKDIEWDDDDPDQGPLWLPGVFRSQTLPSKHLDGRAVLIDGGAVKTKMECVYRFNHLKAFMDVLTDLAS